jgi:hypothetical protein
MPLPRSIVEQEERANAMIAQRQQGNTAPAAPVQQQTQQPQEPVQQAQAPAAQPATEPAPVPPAQAQAPAQTPAFEQTWEQRFKVLDGKYRAEVPRLHQEIKDLKAQLTDLNSQLAAARSAAPVNVQLTDEEREQFGEDFLGVVQKVVKANVPAAPAAAAAPDLTGIEERLERAERIAAETAEEAFFRKLGDKVKHWEQQNTDAGFLKWLGEFDPLIGRTRQEAFNEAYASLNVDRIAAFFTAYPYQSTVSRANSGPSLEQQVTPEVNHGAPPPVAGKPNYSRAQIQKFYDDVRSGRLKDPTEIARIEQDIFAAQRERRIVG